MAAKNRTQAVAAPRQTGTTVGLLIANATVFVSSACVMVVELVAGRLIAKFLGSSLYTWTSIIGIVLAGIAVGNYFGGRIADKYAVDNRSARRTIGVLFVIAAFSTALISTLNDLTGELSILNSIESWPTRVALHITLVFFWPATMLGLISPVVAKMALDLGRQVGRTIGSVYAWGVVGSILGTFLTGYKLVAILGTSAIVFGVAGVLMGMAALYLTSSLVRR